MRLRAITARVDLLMSAHPDSRLGRGAFARRHLDPDTISPIHGFVSGEA